MEIATDHRPAIGTPVRVTFPATGPDTHDRDACHYSHGCTGCPESVTGVVTRHYPDGIDVGVTEVGPSHDVGEEFTLFDSQRVDGVTLEVVG